LLEERKERLLSVKHTTPMLSLSLRDENESMKVRKGRKEAYQKVFANCLLLLYTDGNNKAFGLISSSARPV
jgi:hypothetical protein